MREYQGLLRQVRTEGVRRLDRTGVGTVSVFGTQTRYDLREGFPLLTTKRVHFKSVVAELLWFLSGDTNARTLSDQGVSIWNAWAAADGELGPIYGKQWRSWEARDGSTLDQIEAVVRSIKLDPSGRRHIVSAWNVAEICEMALPPCHLLFQFYVAEGRLSCQLYQRSADLFLGVPFNIASYALLTQMIAQVCDLELGALVHTVGDAHIYLNHFEQVDELLSREPKALPTLLLDTSVRNIDDFTALSVSLVGYEPHPAIRAPVAV